MKQSDYGFLVPSAVACILLAAEPVLAQITQVTDVELNPIPGGISVILRTGTENSPQVFSTKKGKSSVADIVNAQLRLPKGGNFRQENPAPGIAVIEVKQLDTNNMQVTVTGTDNAPNIQPVNRRDNNITLGFTTTVANSTTSNSTNSTDEPAKRPDVLIPNPQVTIDGKIAQSAGPNQPYNQAPPFLPRAVAPPVGDITQSNIDTSPAVINLGTKERVRRLVLRDAPVREVLSLLVRAANLNVVYSGGEAQKSPGAPGGAEGATKTSQTISLDIENEPVQDVFNYVLRLSGLEANRTGRTIFVGTKLPNSTRDTVMRSLRLNQVTVGVALNFLVALGAESAVSRERLVTSVNAVTVGTGVAPITQTQTTTETKIETQRIEYKDSTPLLRGLQASGDERTNSVTLIGNPKMVEMAVSQLVQLDIRRRQVVVNVKIIDVNLLGIQDSKSSFSFGLGNSFFSSDGGAAAFNFGGVNPPSQSTVTGSVLSPAITKAPFPSGTTAAPFFDYQPNSPFGTPGNNNPILPRGDLINGSPNNSYYVRPNFGTDANPLQPGISAVEDGKITYKVPELFQYPKRFLSSLTAQVTNGNAKILTDPSLIVQEGQEASVALTSEVYGGIEITTTTRKPIIKNAGLTLKVKVERIDDNGFVSLSVAPTVSSLSGTTSSPDGDITLLAARSLSSGQLRLRDGQTLILSGIIQDSDRTTVSKLPILGDIPLLGSLFRKSNRTNERREVIVLLTPQIMDDSERSSYGYNYTPSPQVRQVLERRGLKVQPR
jgi:type IV pilus assembly protein PilQ